MGGTYQARLPKLNATVFTYVQGERLCVWFTSVAAPGKPVGTAVALARSLKSWPMTETTALGWEGREPKLPEVWKAKGKPNGGSCTSG